MRREPLRYAEGPSAALDRPGHVRAASALLATPHGHLVIQDDALFLACRGPTGRVEALALPAPDGVRLFGDDRGNKAGKLDLEAALSWPSPGGPLLVALGSGSTPARERVVVMPLSGGPPRVRRAPGLYAALAGALAGAALNVEGAFRTGQGHLRLLQRGNGAGGVDAVIDLDGGWLDAWLAGGEGAPPLRGVVRWHLGLLDGVPLSWTDGLALPASPGAPTRWLFSAAAEASPDAVRDGPVTGSVLGWADEEGGAWAPVRDERGALARVKIEGIAAGDRGTAGGDGGTILAVTDADDPQAPAELLTLRLEGGWPGGG
ncbi:hypothetical protein L6R53_23445 [Myxococcota bacterium]|nr:hypothetical protein [Myxococcota bacterium]